MSVVVGVVQKMVVQSDTVSSLQGANRVAGNGSVLLQAGHSAPCQPELLLIFCLLPKINDNVQ